jgi:spermidine synthase
VNETCRWRSIPASLLSEKGIVHLREPAGSDLSGVLDRLRNGEYDKPFVTDDGTSRRLHFNFRFVQSEMNLQDPDTLSFAYTRKMMAFLLFAPRPKHVVIIGLGGGSLTKFCYRGLPRTRVTTIEIDEDVIGFGELFEIPPPDARLRIVHADATEYFARSEEQADVVMLDGCDYDGVSPALCEAAFYRNVRDRLSAKGVLVANLIGRSGRSLALQRLIGEVFGGRTMTMDVRGGGNRLMFAFNEADFAPDWQAIREEARKLEHRHRLDFPGFMRKLQYSYRGPAADRKAAR